MTRRPSSGAELEAVEALVFDVVAELCRLDRSTLGRATPLLDAHFDSLTLIAVVARIELVCGASFEGEEASLLAAKTLGELASAITLRVRAAARNES
jgi:acyl carrier protein